MPAPVAFPLFKLGVVLVKQISKPIAKRITNTANRNRIFKDRIIVPLAQMVHRTEVNLKMISMGRRRIKEVPKLTEKGAIEQGSVIISEIIILAVAVGLLTVEFTKAKEEKEQEEKAIEADREMLRKKLYDLGKPSSFLLHPEWIHFTACVG